MVPKTIKTRARRISGKTISSINFNSRESRMQSIGLERLQPLRDSELTCLMEQNWISTHMMMLVISQISNGIHLHAVKILVNVINNYNI